MSTEPITEKKPLIAHDHATYSSPWRAELRDQAEAERHEHAEAEPERGEDDQRRR